MLVDEFNKSEPGNDIDRFRIPVVFHTERGVVQTRYTRDNNYDYDHQMIWLNREHFLNLEHDSFLYEFDTGNEGTSEDYAYVTTCVTLNHESYEEKDKFLPPWKPSGVLFL